MQKFTLNLSVDFNPLAMSKQGSHRSCKIWKSWKSNLASPWALATEKSSKTEESGNFKEELRIGLDFPVTVKDFIGTRPLSDVMEKILSALEKLILSLKNPRKMMENES